MKRKMNDITTIFLILLLIAGLSLLLYPTVSDHWNAFHSSQAISSYTESVANLTDEQYKKIWSAAVEYNQTLAERGTSFVLSDAQKAAYEEQLDVSGVGIMGYIEIPQLGVSLPIYHGTEESVLQVAVGHMEWSSLPVGGTSSHCVLSGHRGLPSAKLFTDLDKLQEGDIFMLRVLDEVLTYEVDQIRIVEPSQVSDLHDRRGQRPLHHGHLYAVWRQYPALARPWTSDQKYSAVQRDLGRLTDRTAHRGTDRGHTALTFTSGASVSVEASRSF